MEKKYCFYCNKDVIPKVYLKNNEYSIRNQTVSVKEEIFECPNCKNELINDNLNDSLYSIYDAYLNLNGLSFDKLKEIRKSFNLSQDLFAKALNWSKKSIVRYENAESLPQNQYLNIYKKIYDNKREFLNILISNKDRIEKKTYYKIYDIISASIDIKTINVLLFTLKDNYLTKTQIMKNLFAIDFEAFKVLKTSITKLKYAHGTYGPIIDKKDAFINYLIKNNCIEIVDDEKDEITFKPCQECDISIFTSDELFIMNKVVDKLKGKKASELTKWSHKFKGWLDTKNGEIIDYNYALYFDLNNNW